MSGEAYLEEIRTVLERAAATLDEAGRRALLDRVRALTREPEEEAAATAGPRVEDFPGRFGIIGDCPAMQAVYELIAKLAPSDYPVLITGESGTGKELVARAIHEQSRRKARVFLSENCAAIPETLLESILFGHRKGSFTGAHRDNPGHFVAADKGTLFLDELGDMPLVMQGKLLRVLQDGEVRPVGGDKTIRVDVRLVAATNRDLDVLVREKRFREDLYYRLNVLQIQLPPLRERGDDVLVLADWFLQRSAAESGRAHVLGADAKELLRGQPWPGNVRQLENAIRRAVALAEGEEIGTRDLSLAPGST
ncbi:MAG: sigma-54 dependent transcriptional regulator [Planctomycetota bacterium]